MLHTSFPRAQNDRTPFEKLWAIKSGWRLSSGAFVRRLRFAVSPLKSRSGGRHERGQDDRAYGYGKTIGPMTLTHGSPRRGCDGSMHPALCREGLPLGGYAVLSPSAKARADLQQAIHRLALKELDVVNPLTNGDILRTGESSARVFHMRGPWTLNTSEALAFFGLVIVLAGAGIWASAIG